LCGSCFAACAEFDVLRQECAGVAWTAVAFCLATVAAAVEGFGTGFGALVFVRFDFELVAVDAPHGCVRFAFLFDDYWTGIARAVVALPRAIVHAAVENFGALTGAHRHAARAAFYLKFSFSTSAFSADDGLARGTRSRMTQHGAPVHALERRIGVFHAPGAHVAAAVRCFLAVSALWVRLFAAEAFVHVGDLAVEVLAGRTSPLGADRRCGVAELRTRPLLDAVQMEHVVALGARPYGHVAAHYRAADHALVLLALQLLD